MASKADTGAMDAKAGVKRRPAVKKATAASKRPVGGASDPSPESHARDRQAEVHAPELEPTPQRASRFAAVPSASVMREAVTTRTARRVRRRDVTAFLRQLVLMIEAGTPILKALRTLSTRGGHAGIRNMVAGMTEYVEAGNPLWQAFARESQNFSSVDINLIKASEASGTLTTVLLRIVSYREQHDRMQKKVRAAMIYPAAVVLICGLMIVFMGLVLIPQFEVIFKTMGVEITGLAKTMFTVYKFAGAWGWLVLIALGLLYAANRAFAAQSPLHRVRMDRIGLRIPIMGSLQQKLAISDFMRTFSLMLKSGLSMMSTFDLCRDSMRNRAYADSIQAMRDSVERGEGLEQPLRAAERKNLLPPVIVDMLLTGEDTGQLDVVSTHIADFCDADASSAVDTLGEAVQPVIVVLLGVIVLALILALVGPLVQVIDKLGSGGGV